MRIVCLIYFNLVSLAKLQDDDSAFKLKKGKEFCRATILMSSQLKKEFKWNRTLHNELHSK